mgnify:CR=1 FL=1
MLLVNFLRAVLVALLTAFPAMSLPVCFLLFLPVMAFEAAVPALRVMLVIAAPTAALSTVAPISPRVLPFFPLLSLALRSLACSTASC